MHDHFNFRVLPHVSKPLIAVVTGYCIGFSFETALACDIIFCSDEATFSLPEMDYGLIAYSGGHSRLSRIAGKFKAMEHVLTGNKISAE